MPYKAPVSIDNASLHERIKALEARRNFDWSDYYRQWYEACQWQARNHAQDHSTLYQIRLVMEQANLSDHGKVVGVSRVMKRFTG